MTREQAKQMMMAAVMVRLITWCREHRMPDSSCLCPDVSKIRARQRMPWYALDLVALFDVDTLRH